MTVTLSSMDKIYIALDLETTGFEPLTDEVLEIAAIKFQGDKILETFETLVKPSVEIPAMVSHITGINAETVHDAPSFDKIRENLTVFLGNYPIVGHNIEFDLNFLEAKGIPILSPQFDTLKLANILLPHLPSHSLETISRILKIDHKDKHRAYSDAWVCVKLLNLLIEKIDQIPAPLLSKIKTLLPRATWDLSAIWNASQGAPPRKTPPAENTIPTATSPSPQLFHDHDEITELLGPSSPLSTIMDNYEYRPGQQTFFKKIVSAAAEGNHLIAEAGTGTGKTMAYLLAAAALAQLSGKKAIISTYTNNLQDQVVNKDFPLLQKLFPNLKIALLKGRRKYLDLDRLDKLLSKPNLEEHELTSLIKILLWLEETKTGDLDELNLQNKEILIYEHICSDPDEFSKKPSRHRNYLAEARERAENADIVVINHALLTQDHLAENGIVPSGDLLILDEAHHLEKTLTDAQTVVCSENRLHRLWDTIFETILRNQQITEKNPLAWETLEKALREHRLQSQNTLEKLFQSVYLLIGKFAGTMPGQSLRLAISPQVAQTEQWERIMTAMANLTKDLPDLNQLCREMTDLLQKNDDHEHQNAAIIMDLQGFFRDLKALLENPGDKIVWLNKNFDDSLQIYYAPLSVHQSFQDKIVHKYPTVVLTSATLSTYGNFSYLRHELGLTEHFEEIRIPSHFSYPDQVKIIIPEDLSDPREPNYLGECRQIIDHVIHKNEGKTLVLFTAKKDLSRIFHDLAPSLKKSGISLLAQNITGGRGKIISHFVDEPDHTAILGTNSFWEGVDLIGPVLTCVIIQKLPFDPPDDPIIKARSLHYKKPFEEYSLPRAILRFKQGFGRLIRSASDTGAVIILDSRLVQKSYGQEFISSLPEGIKIHQCQQDQVANYL